jgi:uncharacterized membrane protein
VCSSDLVEITDELVIDAPIERVWQLTVDVEAWPSITPTMTSVERLDHGDLAVGSTARVKQPAQRAAVWTVTRFEPPTAYEWATTVLGVRMVGGHHLEATDAGHTRNRLIVRLEGRGAGLLGRVVGGRIHQAIATENAGFKKAAEQPS